MQELFQKNNTDFDHLIEKYQQYQSTYAHLKEEYTEDIDEYIFYTQNENWGGYNERKVPSIYYYAVLVWLAKNQVDIFEKTQKQLDNLCLTAWGDLIEEFTSDLTYLSFQFNFEANPIQFDIHIHDKCKNEHFHQSCLFDDCLSSEIISRLGEFLH